jgi:hypothetical protein
MVQRARRGIQSVLGLGVRWRRHAGQSRIGDPTAWVAGGLESGQATQQRLGVCWCARFHGDDDVPGGRCKKIVG